MSGDFDHLPAGRAIPYYVNGKISKVRIAKERNGQMPESGKEDYYEVPGGADILYQLEEITAGVPVLLVDEEFDAILIHQEARGCIVPMALGGLKAARHDHSVHLLKRASCVLLCFPCTDAGKEAEQWWSARLPNSKHWPVPSHYATISDIKSRGGNIKKWLLAGIE